MSIPDYSGCTQCSFAVAGGVPILSGLARLQDLRQFRVLEVENHLDSWGFANKQRWRGARLLVDTVQRKQNDAA